MGGHGRATSAEVAREAGVSRATVSYVLNSKPGANISEATAERVRRAASKLGYTPSAAARALKTGSTRLVLAVLPDFDLGPTYPPIFARVSAILQERGYVWLMRSMHSTPESLAHLLENVDCDIVVGFRPWQQDEKKAIIAAGAKPRYFDLNALLVAVARTQVEYMFSVGCKRIGYLLPDHFVPESLTAPRFDHMTRACKNAGVSAPEMLRLSYSNSGIDNLEREWWEISDPITGICAHTDEVAAIVLSQYRDRFRFGPEVLIGLGNRPISRLGITTVEINHDVWARRWVDSIFHENGVSEGPSPVPLLDVVSRGSL